MYGPQTRALGAAADKTDLSKDIKQENNMIDGIEERIANMEQHLKIAGTCIISEKISENLILKLILTLLKKFLTMIMQILELFMKWMTLLLQIFSMFT